MHNGCFGGFWCFAQKWSVNGMPNRGVKNRKNPYRTLARKKSGFWGCFLVFFEVFFKGSKLSVFKGKNGFALKRPRVLV